MIQNYLPEPVPFAFLVHGFPLIGLFLSTFMLRKDTRIVWNRITDESYEIPGTIKTPLYLLLAYAIFVVIWYFSYIPIWKTGLFAIFFDPGNSAQAREDSLKLLSNIPLRYALSFLNSTFALLITSIVYLLIVQNIKHRQIPMLFLYGVMLVIILVIVSLSGARSPAATIILLLITLYFLRKGIPLKLSHVLISVIAVLSLPVLLSIFREGQDFNIINFFNYLSGGIFQRVFVIPMLTGLHHAHYAQTAGFFGIAAIPKIAYIFGIPPVYPSNIIYLMYSSWTLQSGLANTCYVFSYYSYFGLISFIFSLIALWLLDISILVCRKLSNKFLLPCTASVLIASISFVSINYTTVLLTQGFGLILVVSLMLDKVTRIRVFRSLQFSAYRSR
jgi:hypothetical protein